MIDIQIDDHEVLTALSTLQRRLEDLSPAMRDISQILVGIADQAFEDQKTPDGKPWAPLSDVTVALRRKRGKDATPILQDSGQLAGSIHGDYGRDYAVAGTNKKYAATHQFGAKRGQFGETKRGAPIPWGDIPARPFLGLSEDGKEEILDTLSRFLTENLRR